MPAEKLIPPPEHPDEPPFVCVQINAIWIPYIIGLLWPARFPEYWAGTLEENRNARRDVQNLIYQLQGLDECGMTDNCCVNLYVIQRVNVTTGAIEISIDNGVTWQPSPDTIRSHILEPIPPVISGVASDKCQAATNCNEIIHAWIDHVVQAFDVSVVVLEITAQILGAICAAVLAFFLQPELTPAEIALFEGLAGALSAVIEGGKAAFENYWTTDIKDKMFCDLYCTIGDDGSWSEAQFNACYKRLNNTLPNSPAKQLFLGFMSSVGKQGWNNMAAQGSIGSGDCADCDCSDVCKITLWHLLDSASGTVDALTRTSTFVEITASLRADGKYWVIFISNTADNCCEFGVAVDNSGQIYITAGSPNQSICTYCGENQFSILTANHAFGFVNPPINGFAYIGTAPFTLAVDTTR